LIKLTGQKKALTTTGPERYECIVGPTSQIVNDETPRVYDSVITDEKIEM